MVTSGHEQSRAVTGGHGSARGHSRAPVEPGQVLPAEHGGARLVRHEVEARRATRAVPAALHGRPEARQRVGGGREGAGERAGAGGGVGEAGVDEGEGGVGGLLEAGDERSEVGLEAVGEALDLADVGGEEGEVLAGLQRVCEAQDGQEEHDRPDEEEDQKAADLQGSAVVFCGVASATIRLSALGTAAPASPPSEAAITKTIA